MGVRRKEREEKGRRSIRGRDLKKLGMGLKGTGRGAAAEGQIVLCTIIVFVGLCFFVSSSSSSFISVRCSFVSFVRLFVMFVQLSSEARGERVGDTKKKKKG